VLNDYLPIVVLAAMAVAFGVLSLMGSRLLRPRRPYPAKLAPYESGITPVRLPKSERFPVKFYVVAMLFIIFDIEMIFLIPWAVAYRQLGLFGLAEMIVFIGLVYTAYLYVWQKGGFEWEGAARPSREPGRVGFAPLPVAVERGPGEHPGIAPELERLAGRGGAVEEEPTPERA
jgi:NADH-quinone oxidoreductase subunit A